MGLKVIVCTHGSAANELVKSASMIAGEQDYIYTLSFEEGEGLDDLVAKYRSEIGNAEVSMNNQILILVDIIGGSPFNAAMLMTSEYSNVQVMSGVNIPMLVELVISHNQSDNSELYSKMIQTGQENIKLAEVSFEEEDEEF